MNIPTLPTDNLYKFIALTGVVLALICFGTIEYRASNQQKLNTAVALGKEALGYLERDIKRVAERLSAKDESDGEFALATSEEYSQFKLRIRGIDKEIMEVRVKSEMAENYFKRTQKTSYILGAGGGLGLVLAFYGFNLWYKRLQKYQDIILRHQALQTAQQGAKVDVEKHDA